MRDSSAEIRITTTADEECEPSMVSIALGKDSGSFFLTRFDSTTDARWNGQSPDDVVGSAGKLHADRVSEGDEDERVEGLLGLRGGFDESLGLPLATPNAGGWRTPNAGGWRHGIRHVVGAVTIALIIASAGFVLGAGIADRENGDLRSEREIAQVAAPIEVQGPDASTVAEVMDDQFDHVERVATIRSYVAVGSRGANSGRSESTGSPEGDDEESTTRSAQVAPLDAQTINGAVPELAEPIIDVEGGRLAGVIAGALEENQASGALAPQVPRTLTRQQVITGMREVTELVMNCTMTDRVVVDITIDGVTGDVASAQIIGPLTGTAEGSCVERSIRRARFPRFSDDRLNVRSYPFTLRAAQ